MTLPHPEIANRLFVLQPLAELGPELYHPVTKKNSVEMLKELLAQEQEAGLGPQVHITSWASENNEVSE